MRKFREKMQNFAKKLRKVSFAANPTRHSIFSYANEGIRCPDKGLKGIVLNPTCLVFKWKVT